MALETLENVSVIDGFDVGSWKKHEEGDCDLGVTVDFPIFIDHKLNEITFKIQNGPIGDNGVNGCQVDTLIATARKIIEGLNVKYPCQENLKAIDHLLTAYDWLKARTSDREERGVEGKNQV